MKVKVSTLLTMPWSLSRVSICSGLVNSLWDVSLADIRGRLYSIAVSGGATCWPCMWCGGATNWCCWDVSCLATSWSNLQQWTRVMTLWWGGRDLWENTQGGKCQSGVWKRNEGWRENCMEETTWLHHKCVM